MLRNVAAVEQRPFLLLGLVFFATLLFGFVTQAAGSAYLHWAEDPVALTHRTTLSYTSALIGDAIILPIANVLMASQLLLWRLRPRPADVAGALLGAAVLTVGAHLYQAANALLNWTMPVSYAWTPLGYVHALFMLSELTLMLFFWGQATRVARERPRAVFSHRVLAVVLCSLVFLRLLLGDYGYFA
ncbi:MAG: hypothetical protein ACRDF0_06650 [Candidatus Limnocylindria bacterium]